MIVITIPIMEASTTVSTVTGSSVTGKVSPSSSVGLSVINKFKIRPAIVNSDDALNGLNNYK